MKPMQETIKKDQRNEEGSPSRSGELWVSVRSLWLVLAGMAVGLALGLVLPGLLPGASARRSHPSFLWMGQGTLQAYQGGRPMPLLPLLGAFAGEQVEAADSTSDNDQNGSSKQTFDVKAELGTLPMKSEQAFVSYMQERFGEDPRFLKERWELAQRLAETEELQGPTIEAFLRTPREHFVREANIERAYDDTWMPIGYGATITDPDVVSMMTTALNVKPDHRVLEIGTGSGYQSAFLSHLSNHVYTIEIIEPLFRETDALYRSLDKRYPTYHNIARKLGDGFYGWVKYAPFDRIIVTCAIDHLPPPLIRQLTPDGIMVVPLGPPGRQYIMKVEKEKDEKGNISLKRTDVYNGLSVSFIPFLNEQGQSYSSQGE
jgi:protein-L-isoaspartate(D-aspartate) O-methyltransferase